MRFAVNFDDQPRLMTIKVSNVGTGGMLTPEFQSARTTAQDLPQDDFRRRHILPQLSRTVANLIDSCNIQFLPLQGGGRPKA